MHLNPHAKCRSSKFNLKLLKKETRGSLKTWKHIKHYDQCKQCRHGISYWRSMFVKVHVQQSVIVHVTMSNVRNMRISDGCVYAQICKGLGMHLVSYTNRYTVPFLLLVQYKGGLSEIEFTVTLFSNVGMIFVIFLKYLVHFFLYKGTNCPFLLGDIIKLPLRGTL